MNPDEGRHYLPPGLPSPRVHEDALSAPYWQGLRSGKLLVQRCDACGTFQFAPEYLCHACHAFDPVWHEIAPRGTVFSWERVWHPSHPALKGNGPYLVVLVELTDAKGVRMLGNLLGNARQDVVIGSAVEGIFEMHEDVDPPYALLQWKVSTR